MRKKIIRKDHKVRSFRRVVPGAILPAWYILGRMRNVTLPSLISIYGEDAEEISIMKEQIKDIEQKMRSKRDLMFQVQ
jgi:hypothetical protein